MPLDLPSRLDERVQIRCLQTVALANGAIAKVRHGLRDVAFKFAFARNAPF
jgi:hypothetical protein